tara:strand:- start:60 stop:329 length:270 start_codon:yes stop_codon:yes gene_type:complete
LKANTGTFKKKDGSLRTMRFVDLNDLPEGFFTSQTKGSGKKLNLTEGSSLVWDLDKQGFRVFNRSAIIGEIKAFDIDSLNHFELIKDFE